MRKRKKNKQKPPHFHHDVSAFGGGNTGGTPKSNNSGLRGMPPSRNYHLGTREWGLIVLILVFLAEGAGALWFSSEREMLDSQAKEAHSRELRVSQRQRDLDGFAKSLDKRESQLRKNEGELREEGERLAKQKQEQDESLAKQQKELDGRQAAVSHQEHLLKQRDDLLAQLRKSTDRLREAIKGREMRLVEVKHLDNVVKSSENKLEPVRKAKPSRDWEISAREAAIRDLIADREERALRASAETYWREAAVEWELERLRDLARKLNLPDDIVPKNEFELLDRASLDDLEVRWDAKVNELRRRNAAAPGLFNQTLEFATTRLAAVHEAKGKSQTNLHTSFAVHLLRSNVDDEVTNWLANKDKNREAEIRQREGQLLAAALARDRANLPAFVRLVEIESSLQPTELPAAVLRGRQFLILSRASGFSPTQTTATEVSELLKKRFTNPLFAVQCEAKLRLQWQENGFDLLFEAWMVRHLSDGQLFELKVFLGAARDRLRLISLHKPAGLQEYVNVENDPIDKEFKALESEINRRAENKEGVIDVSTVPKDVLKRHLRASHENPSTDPTYKEIHWVLLRRFQAQCGPDSEAKQIEAELAVQGYERQIEELEGRARKITELERDFTPYGNSASDETEYKEAKAALAESRGLIENGLKELVTKTSDAAKVKSLQERVVMNLAAFPPPEGFKDVGLPYGDPGLLRACPKW